MKPSDASLIRDRIEQVLLSANKPLDSLSISRLANCRQQNVWDFTRVLHAKYGDKFIRVKIDGTVCYAIGQEKKNQTGFKLPRNLFRGWGTASKLGV